MYTALIKLNIFNTSDSEIVLDDYTSGSYATYTALNPTHKSFEYFRPEDEKIDEPRCDYILVHTDNSSSFIRFIELKGHDVSISRGQKKCCIAEWDHACHQLYCTFLEYKSFIDINLDVIKMILCTSAESEKRVYTRYKQYKWYRFLREKLQQDLYVFYANEKETV